MDPGTAMLLLGGSTMLYNLLFGGSRAPETKHETVTETPPTGFQDPGLGLLAPLLLGTLTQNASRFYNFGVAGGGQQTPFLGGQNLDSLLALLQKEYEGISKEYGKPKEEEKPPANRYYVPRGSPRSGPRGGY